MHRLLSLFFIVFLTACATTSHKNIPIGYQSSDFMYLDDFCKKYNLQYSFDTLDDMVKISSSGKDLRLILNSNVGYFNGNIFDLKNPPLYSNGKILLSRELEKIISSKEITPFRASFTIKTIVVDPGHGGKDPGAISYRGLEEKVLNLKVAKYLKQELEQKGFRVILTRSQDIYLTLQERVDIAKKHNADLFISIHSNANRSRQMKGVEVYYLSPSRFNSEERAIDLAKEESFGPQKIPFDAEVILWDLLLTKNYALSMDFTHALYFSFKNLGFKVKPPKKAPFYVLRLAYVPSVLVEIGYISNRYEEKCLMRKIYQNQIAEAITLGVVSLNKQNESYADKR